MSTSQTAVMLCGWGVNAGMVVFAGKTVKLCDPCMSALEVVTMMRYKNRRVLNFTYFTLLTYLLTYLCGK